MSAPSSFVPVLLQLGRLKLSKYRCSNCGLFFWSNFYLKKHRKQVHPKSPESWLQPHCAICRKDFATTAEHKCHNRAVHHGRLRCTLCEVSFSSTPNLNRHWATTHAENPNQYKRFECSHCGKLFGSTSEMHIHERVHTGQRPFSCHFCPAKFAARVAAQTHVRTMHTREKPFACNICHKTFSSIAARASHMRGHTGEKPHSCDLCGKAFVTRFAMSLHKRTHTGEKPCVCQMCGHACTSPSGLRDHTKRQHLQPPKQPVQNGEHRCNFCGKCLASSRTLMAHQRRHTGEKPFTCPHCSNSYPSDSQLHSHLITHSELRSHPCPLCDKHFKTIATLKSHIGSHSAERPYSCATCHKTFRTDHSRKSHQAIHTGAMDFACPDCGKMFRWRCDHYRHSKAPNCKKKD